MTIQRSYFASALPHLGLAICLSLFGCSDSEDTADSSSDGNTATATAVANAAAPKLNGIQEAAMAGGEDYSDGQQQQQEEDYGHGPAGGGEPGGGMASMEIRAPGGASGGGMGENFGGMNDGGYDEGEMEGSFGEGSYGEGGRPNSGYGSGRGRAQGFSGGAATNPPSLPSDFNQWSDDDFVKAAQTKNKVLVAAIQTKASQSIGDPAFTSLMGRVLSESAGAPPAPGGMFEFGGSLGNGPNRADSGKGMATPYKPKTKVPPGGAFYFPSPEDRFRSDKNYGKVKVAQQAMVQAESKGYDTVELMIGESLLGYAPQAASAIGARAQGLEAPGLQAPGAQSPNMQSPTSRGPSGMQAPAGGMGATANEGLRGGETGGFGGGPPRSGGQRGQRGQGGQRGQNRPGGPPNGSSGGLTSEALVQAVISGLVVSNTPASWQMIQDIYDGKQATPLASVDAQSLVLAGVLAATDFDDAVVRSVISQAVSDSFANPQNNPQTLKILATAGSQTTAHYFKLARISSSGSPAAGGPGGLAPPGRGGSGFGGASGMAGPGMAGPGMEAPGGFGASGGGNRSNESAGPGMAGPGMAGPGMAAPGMGEGEYGSGNGEGEYGSGSGEGAYGGGSSNGRFAGLNSTKPPAPEMQISLQMVPVFAEILWSPENMAALASAITSAGDLQSAEPLMPLAVATPNDAVRKAVFEILQSQYRNGAEGLASVGFFTQMLNDPGMLPILKSLPRKRPPRNSNNSNAAAAHATPEDTWTDGTKEAVMALRNRLRTAAANPELAFEGALPVRLHRDAQVKRSIRFTTKGDELDSLGKSIPSETTYYYASCDFTPTRAKDLTETLEYYEKRAKAFRRLQSQSLLWFDGMKTTPTGGRVSVDVIFEDTAGGSGGGNYGGGYGGGNEGVRGGGGGGRNSGTYQIELIVVEVHDPKAAADLDETPSN